MKISLLAKSGEEGIERWNMQLRPQVFERVQNVPSLPSPVVAAQPRDPLRELHRVGEDPAAHHLKNEASDRVLVNAVTRPPEKSREDNGSSDLIRATPGIKHLVGENEGVNGAVRFEEEAEEVVVEEGFAEVGLEIAEDFEGFGDPSNGGEGADEEGGGVGGEGEAAEAGLVEESLEAKMGIWELAAGEVEEGFEGGGAMDWWGVVARGPVEEAEGRLAVREAADGLEEMAWGE